MKIFTILLLTLTFSQISIAQIQNTNLECSTTFSGNSVGGVSIGCVSKASIERDKAHTRLLEIQIKLAEAQLKKIQKEEAITNQVSVENVAPTVVTTNKKTLILPTPTTNNEK